MASATPPASQTSMEQICECPVCLQTYVDPRLMNCGHSICAKCIKNCVVAPPGNQISVLRCPICRHETNWTGVPLPVNFGLKDVVSELERQNDGKYVCIECCSRFPIGQMCNCETCGSQMICFACTIKKHKGHESQIMSDVLQQRQEDLDNWRQELMNDPSNEVDWEHGKTVAELRKELNVFIHFNNAFADLKRQWDGMMKNVQDARAKDLVTSAFFDKFLEETPVKMEAIKGKRKRLITEIEAFTNAAKKAKETVAEIVPEVVNAPAGAGPSGAGPSGVVQQNMPSPQSGPSSSAGPSTSGVGPRFTSSYASYVAQYGGAVARPAGMAPVPPPPGFTYFRVVGPNNEMGYVPGTVAIGHGQAAQAPRSEYQLPPGFGH